MHFVNRKSYMWFSAECTFAELVFIYVTFNQCQGKNGNFIHFFFFLIFF